MTDDSERGRFIRAIIDAPADDLPRLVYADWLEETAGMVACTDGCKNGKPDPKRFYTGDRNVIVPAACPTCGGSGEVSDGNRERAELIRLGTAHPDLHWVCLCNRRPGEVCFTCRTVPGTQAIPRRANPGDYGETPYVVHRGFVSEIRLTLAAFVGGATCPGSHTRACYQGTVVASEDEGWHEEPCPACHGTGRTPGCAAAIFREHPVDRVVLTDREPADRMSINERWYWFLDETHIRSGDNRLPREIFRFLTGVNKDTIGMPYLNREFALEDISAACVAYGRALAFPALASA